ncbi:hypothetical protein K2Q16_03935 [Patescibacteria group bacterium]|nr:hypothetical protein [Patescibacteria group bacterium]
MNKSFVHTGVALLIGFFLLVIADLVPFWMPMMGELVALVCVTVLLLLWASFMLYETAVDEREVQLKTQSGRVAYLAGLAILLVALISQSLSHTIDPWIPAAIATMVLVKHFTRLYLE